MPNYNPFNRANINKDVLKQLKQQMLDCKTLEEANQLLEKFSNENNIPVKQDNLLDSLKNVFLLCVEEENDKSVTFISYARKILSSNDVPMEQKKGISGVIEELTDNVDKMGLSTKEVNSINGILDIKHLIDHDHIDYITNPTYLRDEKALTEAYELYREHSAWYYEIAEELAAIPYGIKFDSRDFMPLMHVVMLDKPNCTKDEYQAKCREIKNLLATNDMEKINKLYDVVFDFRDNFALKDTDYSEKHNCYKLITSLCMNQAYGTMTDKNKEYKSSRYMSSVDGVQKWDKELEMNNEINRRLANECLNFGICINDTNGGSTLPFYHYSKYEVAKESYELETSDSLVDYHDQKYKVFAGEKNAADFNLTEGFLEVANLINANNPDIKKVKNILEQFDVILFPTATNHNHYNHELDLDYILDYVFVNGKTFKDAFEDYKKAHPEFEDKMKDAKVKTNSDKMQTFLLNAIASGQAVDMAQMYCLGDNFDVKMIPLKAVNPKNIRNEVNQGVDYNEVAEKNAAGQEERLAKEKESLLNKIKEKKICWLANKMKEERIKQADKVERAKYNDFKDVPFALDADYTMNIASLDLNSPTFTQLAKAGVDKFFNDYKNGAEAREAEAKEANLRTIEELIRGIKKANVWTYSASNHPEFAAVRDALEEVREAYNAEKPVAATYMDVSQKDALKVYYERIETALEKLEIASSVYTDNRKELNRDTASTRAVNRFDAVMACMDFIKSENNKKMVSAIDCFDTMLVAQKRLEDPNYKPMITPYDKADFGKVLEDSLETMQGAVTKHDSEAYGNVIKAAKNTSNYSVILNRETAIRNTKTIKNYRESLAELMDKSEKYLKHKAEKGMKENSYGKVDAVIDLYEKTKKLYDSLGERLKTTAEKERDRDKLDNARLDINVTEIDLEEKIETNPAAKRFYYLGKNAPDKKTQEKLYKAGLDVGDAKVKKSSEKAVEKREKNK